MPGVDRAFYIGTSHAERAIEQLLFPVLNIARTTLYFIELMLSLGQSDMSTCTCINAIGLSRHVDQNGGLICIQECLTIISDTSCIAILLSLLAI